MTRVAVVKPDHIGDLILSIPAIRAIRRQFQDVTLFVSETTRPLVQFLFPDLGLRTINFLHLIRSSKIVPNTEAAAGELSRFDLVLWLRDDPFIGQFYRQLDVPQDVASGSHLVHETAVQKAMVLRHSPNYSRTELFSNAPIAWPESIKTIGLSIGSGFPTNRWPNICWLEIATLLKKADKELVLMGGPNEEPDLSFLSNCLRRMIDRVIIGSSDFSGFFDELAAVDLVIATDGGTAHLCSLQKPVLSIFGSSPWRRFAPFGRENLVITRNLSCSPCCNFSLEEINGCLTRECILGIEPRSVAEFLLTGSKAERSTFLVQRGTSHTFDSA